MLFDRCYLLYEEYMYLQEEKNLFISWNCANKKSSRTVSVDNILFDLRSYSHHTKLNIIVKYGCQR